MNKSLKDLKVKWEYEVPKEGYSTPIQLRAYRLFCKKVNSYNVDDLRFMIIQEIGCQFLVEEALTYLKNDILIEASYYEGDLLNSIFKIPDIFWEKYPDLCPKFIELLKSNEHRIDDLDMSIEVEKEIFRAVNKFLKHYDK